MLLFDENLEIQSLPVNVYKKLVYELDKTSNWRILVKYICKEFDCEGNEHSLIESLERNKSIKQQSPSEKLLFELNTQLCTVGILGSLLENCGLLNALSILSSPEPLVILEQPIDKSSKEIEISINESLSLTCKAIGMPPPNYIWFKNNISLDNQRAEELNIIISDFNQEGIYKCKVYQTDLDGCILNEVFSESVKLSIKPIPIIIEEEPPQTTYVMEGYRLTISCKAKSHPPPQYQWLKNNIILDQQTSNTLSIDQFNIKDEGKYYCHIFNEFSEIYTQRCHVIMDFPKQKAAAKIALLIANQNYESHNQLRTPERDVAHIAKILEDIGFICICLVNLSLIQMKRAICIFSEAMLEGVYGLFYFAGHGFKMQESYMLPVDAPKFYLRNNAICESELLSEVLKNDPALFVNILDVCQTVPVKEINPVIHEEVPLINEYKGGKNLRNLVQAYSTSSHRPSYERSGNKLGIYAEHLSKFIERDLLINKMFEEVGKSIDTHLKGTERNQIPMFSSTITKPFRLTDPTSYQKPKIVQEISQQIKFQDRIIDINYENCEVKGKLLISAFMKPYLNIVRIHLLDLKNYQVNFYNSVPLEKNNLYQNSENSECWIYNPQLSKGSLVICLLKNGVSIGATLFDFMKFVPILIQRLK